MMTTSMTPAAASGDAELVNASLAGSREAFGQIVSRYQSLLCSLAYSATGSLSQSEDLAQETFLTAWKDLAELREPAKLRAWLCGIARNLIHNSLRAQGREPSHRAESLDEIPESRSPEPLPVERVISREEAEILWRSLERIPETYRVPLILFYREHQSVEAVAQNLELTEDAVRQRLSRGRKLLQEEVLAFVEGALEKTAPGKVFTAAVVAALPLVVTSAKAASVGIVAGKGAVGVKGIFSLSTMLSSLTFLAAFLFSWKTAVDDTKSPRERKFVVRTGFYQFLFFAVSVGAAFYWLPKLTDRPWVFASALALLLLANVAIGVWAMTYGLRRRMEIGMEEGTLWEATSAGPQADIESKALRKTVKLTIPMLLMFAAGAIALPWRQHWLRSAVVVAGLALVIFWFFRRTQRLLAFQTQPRFSRGYMRRPFVAVSVVFLGIALVAGIGGYLLPLFLHPEAARSGIPFPTWLRPFGLCLLIAIFAYAVAYASLATLRFAVRHKVVPPGTWLARKLDVPFLKRLRSMTQGPDAVIEMTYAPLFEQLNLDPDQRAQLKDLVLKRTMVGVRAAIPLMNSRLDTAKRAALMQQIRIEMDAANAQIKEVLGGDNCVVFQDFEKTIPDRTMLDLLSRRSARTAAKISPEQQSRLLEALTEARHQYPWTTELSRRNQCAALFAEGNLETFAREEEEFDRQFLAQARQLLSPEQFVAFEDAQQRQRRSQIVQLKTAVKLFAPKNR